MTSLPIKNNSGQALLIVVLVMAVALTVGLAVISRSVTDVRITQQSEESARVFSVAEAGIEEALKSGITIAEGSITVPIGDISAEVTRIDDANKVGGGTEFAFSKDYNVGETQTFWLIGHSLDGSTLDPAITPYTPNSIEVYWGNDETLPQPALEVTLIYDDSGFKIAKYPLDPYGTRRSENNFTLAEHGNYEIGGRTFKFKKVIPEPPEQFPAGTKYALRLRLLYNDKPHGIGIKSTDSDVNLPKQGDCYESSAKDTTNLTNPITRTIQQCRFYKAPPAIFDYVLYSEGDLVK